MWSKQGEEGTARITREGITVRRTLTFHLSTERLQARAQDQQTLSQWWGWEERAMLELWSATVFAHITNDFTSFRSTALPWTIPGRVCHPTSGPYSTSRYDSPLTRETSASLVGGRRSRQKSHKWSHLEERITAQEMSGIIRSLKKRRSPALDNFTLISFVTYKDSLSKTLALVSSDLQQCEAVRDTGARFSCWSSQLTN